jgi:ribokinase
VARRIIIVGSINTDLVATVDHFPALGETVIGRSFGTFGGGKGANQAMAAARLGAPVMLVGVVGTDAYGDEQLVDLASEGVEIAAVARVSGVPSGIALIQVNADAENTITIVPGANGTVTAERVEQVLPGALRPGDVLCCQTELPLGTIAQALEIAGRAGPLRVLNAAPVSAGVRDLVPQADILIVNEVDATDLAGLPDVGTESASKVSGELAGLGPSVVIITLRAAGAYVRSPEFAELVASPPVPVVDTTGAGDAFIGALLTWIAEGWPLDQALRAGVAAGAGCTNPWCTGISPHPRGPHYVPAPVNPTPLSQSFVARRRERGKDDD